MQFLRDADKIKGQTMAEAAAVQITHPANRARQKAQPIDDADFKSLLQMAEASAKRLGVDYADSVNVAAHRLGTLATTARTTRAQRPEALESIQDMAFEMRGEGASFGFDVVSLVADSLYKLVDGMPASASTSCFKIVEMHALALNALLAGGIRIADDDPVARQIIAALAAASAKMKT